MPNAAEKDLAAFLAALHPLERKYFEHGFSSFTEVEMNEWNALVAANPEQSAAHTREFHIRLNRAPAKLRAYRKRERQEMKKQAEFVIEVTLGKVPKGRPRLDDLASEAEALKREDKSYAEVALRLNQMHGADVTTRENVRGLLRSRRRTSKTVTSPVDKTQK